MTSTPDLHLSEPVRDLLRRAMDLPASQRIAFVGEALAPGAELDEVCALLRQVEELDGFLERAVPVGREAYRPALPSRIGSYRVERLLGWGSMGVVYLAYQAAPHRPVALKVLRLDASSRSCAHRFEQEGQVLARLSHPNIASVYEAGLVDLGSGDQPFLAIEYVDGEPITRFADRRRLSARERVALMVTVARAVRHAHEEGVLHRDLKPENLLVSESGEPYVLDFGVARTTWEHADLLTLTATGQVVGTIAYMAPEQARGATLDARADQFSLGIVLYELLTGELPFDVRGRLPHEALRAVSDGVIEPPTTHRPELAGDLEAVVLTALAPEPPRRYASVGDFADDLDRWLAGRPVHARAPGAFETLTRFVRRNRGLSVTVVAVALIVGAACAWSVRALLDARRADEISVVLSDLRLLDSLRARADELWPTSSSTAPAFADWLALARGVVERIPAHRSLMADLEAGGAGEDPREPRSDDWLRARCRELADEVEAFEVEWIPELEARAATAASLRHLTVEDRLGDWRAAAERVRADDRFGGFDLEPQEGLVPLGPDPESGLEELAVWGTGELPRRGADGTHPPREGDAIVLVLVPGGDVWIGAQWDDPDGANYDPFLSHPGREHEGPPVLVHLDPYLIGKHELTQAQWARVFGANPSEWEVGATVDGKLVTGLHPVESLSQRDLLASLARIGLSLPTEAQWEHAARGASAWPGVLGATLPELNGKINWNAIDPGGVMEGIDLSCDDYTAHRPAGSLPANGYGLHEVLGNVWELCLDVYKVDYHALPHRDGDGRVVAESDGDVPRRGACASTQPVAIRVYARGMKRDDGRDNETGARVARALRPSSGGESWRTSDAPDD